MSNRSMWLYLAIFASVALIGWCVVQAEHRQPARRILFYRDPMHPSYTSKTPGRAPDCGMPLEPVYADEVTPHTLVSQGIDLTPSQEQLVGVAVTTAVEEPVETSLRTLGRVAPEEARVYTVSAGSEGWVREVHDSSTGSFVRKGAPLARLFSRELQTPEQSYLFALEAGDAHVSGRVLDHQQTEVAEYQARQAADTLQDLGMSPEQIHALKQQRQFTSQIVVKAPVSGFVLSRTVFEGQRFNKGEEFYRVADLSRVWILTDITAQQARFLGATQTATVFQDGKKVSVARLTPALPQFDAAARTLRVRLEASNPSYELRPDQFVDIVFKIRLPPAVTLPSDAIIDSGLRKVVYIERGSGHFEQQVVQVGWNVDDRVQILDGLIVGERVVTEGNFLLDSESRLKTGAHD